MESSKAIPSTSNCFDDDCMIVDEKIFINEDKYWIHPKFTNFFDKLQYDMDSVLIIGDPDMSWLAPRLDFECRLDITHATFLKDGKVKFLFAHCNVISST